MRRWIALCLVASVPAAAAGFEVHEVDAPSGRIMPGEAAGITVDLDVDCASAWLHDPYVIEVVVASAADIAGPSRVEVPRSACDAPEGVAEVFPVFNVTVPMRLPAYTDIAVDFTFTSSDHPLDASQTHNASVAVQPDGAPAIQVTADRTEVRVEDAANVTLRATNVGNVPVDVAWEPIVRPGLFFEGFPRLERGASADAVAHYGPDGAWRSFTTTFSFTAVDPEGKVSVPQNVSIAWEPAARGGPAKDSPLPGMLLFVPLAAAAWRRR